MFLSFPFQTPPLDLFAFYVDELTDAIEKLGSCAKLQVLNLSSNNIESVSNNITSCTQLWSINLANNKVSAELH